MLRIPYPRKSVPAGIAVIFLCGSVSAQPEDPAILEEIFITSQKRELSLQDVPASVAAVSGEKIEQMGIEKLEDLTSYVPNIHLTQTGLSTQMRIRGIGSDNSQGFEQSVGVYMDGIYRGRAQLFRAPIFDVERVEVMRGPQSTFFGKNSIAGALDIISARPESQFGGQFTGSYETEFETRELSGYVTGPLSGNVNGRLAVRAYEDPGFIKNTVTDTFEPNQDELALRLSLDYAPNPDWDIELTIEHDTFDVTGRGIEITRDSPATSTSPGYGTLVGMATGGLAFDSDQDYQRQANTFEFSNNTINSQTLNVEYTLGEYTVTSLTGLLGFNYDEQCDCDFVPANVFQLELSEDYRQFSQELRIASPLGSRIEWIAGVFYQQYDQEFVDILSIPTDSALPVFLAGVVPPVLGGTGAYRDFTQDSEAGAVFGELTWNTTDTMRMTLGARYTHEEKNATKSLTIIDIGNNYEPIDSATLGGIYRAVFNADTEQSGGHNLDDRRSESAFTPSLSVAIDLSEDVLAYGKISRGFKAGGFDPRSNNTANFEFRNETVDAFEIGYKMRLAEGRGELNTTLYRMHYNDLQISQFDGAVGFNVGNARETHVQGVELDGRWQLNRALLSRFGFSWLDFEYEDFDNGDCHYGRTPQANGFCDYSGQRGVYTPEFTFNGALEYMRSLSAGRTLLVSLDGQWVDDQQVHVNLDPNGEIDAYTMLSMRIALETEHWDLALLGRNLLNEDVISYSANVPLSETLAGSNTFYSFPRRPRTVAVEATYRF